VGDAWRGSRSCSVEDVHWAEEPPDVEYLANRIDDAPVLIVCLSRRLSRRAG
jgi:hypothetical protein